LCSFVGLIHALRFERHAVTRGCQALFGQQAGTLLDQIIKGFSGYQRVNETTVERMRRPFETIERYSAPGFRLFNSYNPRLGNPDTPGKLSGRHTQRFAYRLDPTTRRAAEDIIISQYIQSLIKLTAG
jgi:hypothetical protein